jgi:hypothetical protein
MSLNIDYSTIKIRSDPEEPPNDLRSSLLRTASNAANDAVIRLRSGGIPTHKKDDDGSDLVGEILKEFPPADKGEREEWGNQEGWHRKEDIKGRDQPASKKSQRRANRRRRELSISPENLKHEEAIKKMIHDSVELGDVEASSSESSVLEEKLVESFELFGAEVSLSATRLRGSKILLPLAEDYPEEIQGYSPAHVSTAGALISISFLSIWYWWCKHREGRSLARRSRVCAVKSKGCVSSLFASC